VIARGTSLALRGKILAPYARAHLDSMQFEIPGWQHAAENPNGGRARVVYESKLEAAKQARQHEAEHANSVSGNLPAEPTLELVEGTLRQ
jgi:hypothetical protein